MRRSILFLFIVSTILSCKPEQTVPPSADVIEKAPTVVTVTPEQFTFVGIKTGTIEKKQIGIRLQVNGVLDVPPQNLITISAPMGGFIKSTKLLQGMKIKKGELLVTLENQEYIQLQQDYLDNKSKLEFLQSEYNRQQELAKENINAQKTLQQSKAQYHSALAIVKGLEAKLGLINISHEHLTQNNIRSTISLYAPLNGYVTVVNVNIGQFVNAADVIFKIVNLEHLHAELQVFERDIHSLRVGQVVSFKLANESGERGATVHLIGKEISPDRTVRVHCHLDEEDENLLPGMYISATIESGTQERHVLPSDAVVNFEGADFVFVQEAPNEFKLTPIKTGQTADEFIEVEMPANFDNASLIVTGGAFNLLGMLKNTEDED